VAKQRIICAVVAEFASAFLILLTVLTLTLSRRQNPVLMGILLVSLHFTGSYLYAPGLLSTCLVVVKNMFGGCVSQSGFCDGASPFR